LLATFLLQEPAPQEPAPQEPAAPQQPETQEQEQGAASPEEISEAIEKVRQSFADLDKSMLSVRDFAEQQAIAPETDAEGVGSRFSAAVADADQLLNNMEELLAMLPAADQSPSSSPSGGNGQSKQQGEPKQLDGQKPSPQPDDADLQQSPDDGHNEDGENQNLQQVQGIFMNPGQGGAWGHLPPRLQQTLENAQAEDLPLRYRNLLEQYYRKSNEQ